MSIACALAEALHHSSGCPGFDRRRVGVAQHGAVRGQTTATRARGPATQYFTFGDDEDVPAPGVRLFWPQERGLRRSPAHDEELSLDVPALQMVEQPEEVVSFFRNFVPAVAEQVIEVPKLALPVCAVHRAALPEPQLVEQLVEVPTVLSYSLLQQRTAEQIVDTPVPHGRGRGARGGLQGLSQGQGSTAVSGAVHVNTPVPHVSGGGARGGLQGLSQGQGSTAVCGAVSPALHGRGRFSWRSSRPLPRTGLNSGLWSMSTLLFLTVVEEVLVEVFKASPRDRAHQRFVEQKTSTFPFLMVVLEREVFTVFPEDRVPQCLLLSRPSVLIVEVLNVFLVDRVPQRLPSSRLFLGLLIDRCHKPRFMAVMTSGCAWLMWRTTTSTTGTDGTTLRAGGCRGESSTAGACSPLASTGMLCCRRSSGIFPLSDHILFCILAGMDQKDTYAVGFGGDYTFALYFSSVSGVLPSSSSTEWWTFLFYEYGFGRPSLEWEVQSAFRVHSSSCGAH